MPAPADARPQLDLWRVLEAGVCREPGRGGKPDPRGRIAIADSKLLKLSSSVKTTHPLVHLERGVLCTLLAQCEEVHAPLTDDWLLEQLSASWPVADWYQGRTQSLPVANDEGLLRIAASQLRRAMFGAGVRTLAMRCRVIGEREFNELASQNQGGKAATTAHALRDHLLYLWDRFATVEGDGTAREGRLGIVCDRQGGRAMYASFLRACFPSAQVTIIEESEVRSSYTIEQRDQGKYKRAGISFLVQAEQAHLPVALASMIAKLTRELAMSRFNQAWSQLARERAGVELRPTAGYATDAGRWLNDARQVLSRAERDALLRTC